MANMIEKKWFPNVKAFVHEQHDIEKNAKSKSGFPWDRDDEKRFLEFGAFCLALSQKANETKQPVTHKNFKKIYKHAVDGSYWHLNVWFHPDGRVEFVHNKVAHSTRMRA